MSLTDEVMLSGRLRPDIECAPWVIDEVKRLEARIKELEQKLEGLEDALNQVNNWCKAYPIEVFTEPDWDEVKEKLGSTLLTQVSGSNMRHITNGITKIIVQAITNTGDKT